MIRIKLERWKEVVRLEVVEGKLESRYFENNIYVYIGGISIIAIGSSSSVFNRTFYFWNTDYDLIVESINNNKIEIVED